MHGDCIRVNFHEIDNAPGLECVLRSKIRTCRKYDCHEPPHCGGLCKKHHEEGRLNELRRTDALSALHDLTVKGRILENAELKAELLRLRDWWDRVVRSMNYRIADPVLGDEVESAKEWCILLAQEIVAGEMAIRNGTSPSYMLDATRLWVWDRFKNLEAGLMSNGVPRQRGNERRFK